MPINESYSEEAVVSALATALDSFYTTLTAKMDKINIRTIIAGRIHICSVQEQ